jgi:polyphosphate glucokinase
MPLRSIDKNSDMRILSIDIGGTGLKASVIDDRGDLLADRVRIKTPDPCPPKKMVEALTSLVEPLPKHDRIAIGFPGVVRNNVVVTAPHFGTKHWAGFALADALSDALGGPALMINDAEVQGLAVIKGKGLELVLTLGTGAGTGLFRDGDIMPHMELAHHPVHKGKTYDEYIGDDALKSVGRKHWNKRVYRVIGILETLLNYDHLFIGGGNARHIKFDLPKTVTIVSNDAGIEGGAGLWRLVLKNGSFDPRHYMGHMAKHA